MQKFNHPIEKLVETIIYEDVEFEVVERPEVLWVGCLDYAKNNTDEPDTEATLKRLQWLVVDITTETDTRELMCPDWFAQLWINYGDRFSDKPNGVMFAHETYSDKQDKRFDVFTQPGGLWLRVRNDNAAAWLGKAHEYLETSLKNGYMQNHDIHVQQVTCQCQVEPYTNYVYIPIRKI